MIQLSEFAFFNTARHTLTMILLILCYHSFGQCDLTIFGAINDKENNFPVSFVAIQLKGTSIMTSSDSLGNFSFSALCSGDYTIQFSRIGFTTVEHQIHLIKNQEFHIQMEFNPSVFRTVEVLDHKSSLKKTLIGNELVMSNQTASQKTSLGEQLKSVPGLNVLSTGNNVMKPVIHGIYGNRVLIYNNEIKHESQQWGNEHAPEIDPFIAEKITIIKGANALRYGHDAIGGVILLDTADPRNATGINGEITSLVASNGGLGVMTGRIECRPSRLAALSLHVQGTLKCTGNVQTPNYYQKNTGTREHNFSTTANYEKSKFSVQIFYSQFNTKIGIFSGSHIGNLADLERAFTSTSPLDSSGFSYHIGRPYQHIEHELLKIKAALFTGIKGQLNFIYGRQYNLRNEYDKFLPRNDSIAALDKPELHLEITTHSADMYWDLRHSNAFQTQIGMSGITQANTYEGRYFIPNFRQNGIGAFFIETWKHKNTTIETGVRYDVKKLNVFKYENGIRVNPEFVYKDISASVGMHQKIARDLSIVLNAASAWRPPQASELFSNGLHHGAAAVEIGNPTMTKEKSYQFQTAIQYQKHHFGFNASPYLNFIHNFIFLTPRKPASVTIRGAFPTFIYTQSNVIFKGMDFYAFIKSNKQLQLSTSISILRATNQSSQNFITQIPADKYQVTLDQKFHSVGYFREPKFSIGGTYVNRQWRVPENIDYLPPPKAYFLFQLSSSVKHHLKSGTISCGLSVTNLLNTRYRDYMNRLRYFSDDMGRNITLQLSYVFNQNTKNP